MMRLGRSLGLRQVIHSSVRAGRGQTARGFKKKPKIQGAVRLLALRPPLHPPLAPPGPFKNLTRMVSHRAHRSWYPRVFGRGITRAKALESGNEARVFLSIPPASSLLSACTSTSPHTNHMAANTLSLQLFLSSKPDWKPRPEPTSRRRDSNKYFRVSNLSALQQGKDTS